MRWRSAYTYGIVAACAIAVTALAAQAADSRALARALNDKGMGLHQKKQYALALEAFRSAAQTDTTYALAWYNAACAASMLKQTGGDPCSDDTDPYAILDLLERAVKLDPKRAQRAVQDSDLLAVSGRFRFARLIGLDPARPADIAGVLVSVSWYGPSPGAYGPTCGYTFRADGTFSGWTLVFEPQTHHEPFKGTWRIDGATILVKPHGAKDEVRCTMSAEGVLKMGDGVECTDDDGDCSA